MRLLITGATGKVGHQFLPRFLAEERFKDATVVALCHNRTIEDASGRVESVKGSIANRADVRKALQGVTHVLHMATVKETPEEVMDVAVKGMFWLLEECRVMPRFKQFIVIGGDCTVGHFVYPYDKPVTEQMPLRPYKGCYALSKVIEEVMLEQYYTQYKFNGCCLRAPWIMEKDDFKCHLSFGDDNFGGPNWANLVGPADAAEYQAKGTVPVMLDTMGEPVLRNFVHVHDLVEAILLTLDNPKMKQQLINVSMDEPVDYRKVADYLRKTRGLDSVEIFTEYHSTWLDNTKAKFLLGWRPKFDLPELIEAAWTYQRGADDPRKVYYPG